MKYRVYTLVSPGFHMGYFLGGHLGQQELILGVLIKGAPL